MCLIKVMELGLKWIHMARYELILKLDGALWLTIISKPLLTPRRAIQIQLVFFSSPGEDTTKVNSEGFLAEVFHPWVRWEGPGSGFENSSGAAGAVWKSKWVGPSWAHVGGPKLGPRGWAQAGPMWVGPGYTDLAPLGLRSKNKVFELSG